MWYQIQLHRAIPIDIETFHAHRLQIRQHSSRDALTVQPQPQQAQLSLPATKQVRQPVRWAGDSTGCQFRLDWQAVVEYDSGVAHGKLDAANQMPPICTQPTCHYSQGYLAGYNDSERSQVQPETAAPPQWSVTCNAKRHWYEVWVGNAHAGKASSYEEAERIAQKYLAAEKLRSAHRKIVLATFAP